MRTAREISLLVERNQQEATKIIAAIWEPIADGGVAFDGDGSYLNRASGLGIDGPVTDVDLDRLIAFFASHGADPRVEISAYADPSLVEGLGARGFVLKNVVHVFARELAAGGEDLARALPHPTPEGVAIERVDPADDAALRACLDLSASGFLPEGATITDEYRRPGMKSARLPTSDTFVARLDGEVVGAAASATRNGATVLFGATVAKAVRRRGIQQALIAARLESARRRGATLATIAAQPGVATERNALRFGFQLAYARVILVRPPR